MRALVLAVGCVAFVGCTFGTNTCTSDGDCMAGGRCDIGSGLCVSGDGGSGGGGGVVAGGGGGGTMGGGSGGGGGGMGGGGGSIGGGGGTTGGGGGTVDLCAGVSCLEGYSCEPTTGECLLRVTGLRIISPDAPDAGLTNDAGVLFVAGLSTDASVALPATLTYRVDNGAPAFLNGPGPQYSNSFSLADGPHTLRVEATFADAGFVATTLIKIDTDGPTLTGNLPTTRQQRDEIFQLDLTASEAVQLNTVDVEMEGIRLQQATGSCLANAGCWVVNMSLPPLDSLTSSFMVTATALDLAGNSKTSQIGSVQVTRKRWEASPTASGVFRAAPAIDRSGTILVGSETGSVGTLLALNWVDGGVLGSTSSLGAIVSVAAAVSADAGLVYFSSNDIVGGQVGARLASDLTLPGSLQPAARGNAGTNTYSAVALVSKSVTETGAIASFNNGPLSARVVVYGPASAVEGANATGGTIDFAAVPSPLEVASNITVDGTEANFLNTLTGAGMNWQTITNVSATPAVGSARILEAGGNDCCLSGQAFISNSLLIGGRTLGRKLYAASTSGVLSGNLGVAVDNGTPAAVSTTVAFVGRGTDLIRFNPSDLTAPGVALKAVTSIRTSPVLGNPRAGQSVGLGYGVNSLGVLFVFPQDGSTGSASDWGSPFTGSATVYAHPALDCNRRSGAATTTTGILYVASTTKVVAIVVDSPKLLDTPGAWPKYQRTAGNAGNTDNTRFPLNPGCP